VLLNFFLFILLTPVFSQSIMRSMFPEQATGQADEATASLDVENETKIQTALPELVRNKTVLIIAHRMRTVANANKIVVLDKGRVAETGSPEDLKKQNGLFARMLNRGQ
jgi:ATP-binding cassette subfamily B protein